MGVLGIKKENITSFAGTVLIMIGVGMYISLWIIELPHEFSGGVWYIWLIPIIPASFGTVLLFSVDAWVKRVLHLSDKASEKIINKIDAKKDDTKEEKMTYSQFAEMEKEKRKHEDNHWYSRKR